MTVSPYEPPVGGGEVEQYRPEARDVRRLRDWADAALAAHRVATMLVSTSFVPQQYRGKPEEAAAAILAGFELGFEPIASLGAFSPIQGRAAPNARTLMAVVLSKGHEMELIETTAARCIMRGRRRGAEKWQTVSFTMDQARALGVAQRNPEYRKQPATMLIARCTSQLARLVAPDAIMGIPYSSEELRDADPDAGTEAATDAGAAPARRRRGTPVRAEAPEGSSAQTPAAARTPVGPPPLPGEPGYDGSDEPTASTPDPESVAYPDAGEPADDAAVDAETVDTADDEAAKDGATADADKMLRRVFALLREVEVGDRHKFASELMRRSVSSFNELTASDLQKMIEKLEDIKREAPTDGNDQR